MMADQLTDFQRILGALVYAYAQLEFHLRRYILFMSDTTPEVLTVLVGFPRISDAMTKLGTLVAMSALPEPSKAAVADAIAQLRKITETRDRLVHYGGNPVDDPAGILIRKKPAHSSGVPELHSIVDRQDLRNMLIDMQTVSYTLHVHLDRELPAPMLDGMAASLGKPWRYNPKAPSSA